jgi:nicotinamidase-related amidase
MTLLSATDTVLVVVDVQERLVPAIQQGDRIVWNTRRLIDGAKLFSIPVIVTEQYPKGLGPTMPELIAALPEITSVIEKKSFSACLVPEFLEEISCRESVRKVLLTGMESHVCILQTALDLLSLGYEVHLVVDAVGSRFAGDEKIAIRRLESSGVILTTTESALFQWCRTADAPQFKAVSQIVREEKMPF